MNTPEALDGMMTQLVRRGLPAEYSRRAVDELADHYQDLVEELRAAGESESQAAAEADRRLGEPRTLVKKTIGEYQRRYWCGRWPLITFLLGPIPAVVLAWVATSLLSLCIVWPLLSLGAIGPYECDGILSAGERSQVYFMQGLYLFVLPMAVTLLFARLAKRAALNRVWVVVAAGMLAAMMVTFECGIPDPLPVMMNADGTTLPADRFFCRMGFPESWSEVSAWFDITHAPCLLPLGIAGVMLFRRRHLALRAGQLALADC